MLDKLSLFSNLQNATFRGDTFEPHKLSFFTLKSWSPQVVAPLWPPQVVVLRHF
jgi:hypothetical protein